jgi:hypothetical protein
VNKKAVIREEGGKFCVRSPNNPDWNGGCYDTKGEAEDRLKEVEFFKRNKASMDYSYDRTASVEPPPNEHYVEKCSKCGTVISQCRCMGPKVVRWGVCDKCQGIPAPQPSPWTLVASVTKEQEDAARKHFKGRGMKILNEMIQGLAAEARKDGIPRFGMKDATQVMRLWFNGDSPTSPVEESGYRYLKSTKGSKIANLVVTGVAEVMKKEGKPVGFKDIGEVVVSFMAGTM